MGTTKGTNTKCPRELDGSSPASSRIKWPLLVGRRGLRLDGLHLDDFLGPAALAGRTRLLRALALLELAVLDERRTVIVRVLRRVLGRLRAREVLLDRGVDLTIRDGRVTLLLEQEVDDEAADRPAGRLRLGCGVLGGLRGNFRRCLRHASLLVLAHGNTRLLVVNFVPVQIELAFDHVSRGLDRYDRLSVPRNDAVEFDYHGVMHVVSLPDRVHPLLRT